MLNGHSPEHWMCGPVAAQPGRAREAAKETIRQWYERTTKRWRKALVWATIAAVVGGAVFYALASFPFLARLQTFNGAMTIPVAALIWMLIFVFIFLVPSREASFRSQEWIEAMVSMLEQAVREEVVPVAVVWKKIGERLERDLPVFIQEFRGGLETVKTSALRLEQAVAKNEQVSEQAKPVIEALKRIEDRLEREIKDGLIEDLRGAAKSVKAFAVPPPPGQLPSIDRALAALGKNDGTRR